MPTANVFANAHLLEEKKRLFISIFCVQTCRPLIGSMCFDFFAKTFSSKGRLASRVTTMAVNSASTKLASFWCKGYPPLSQRWELVNCEVTLLVHYQVSGLSDKYRVMQRKHQPETREATEVPAAVEVSTIVSRNQPQGKTSEAPRQAPIAWSEPEEKTATPIRCKTEGTSFGCCSVLRSTGNVDQLNNSGCFPMKTEQIVVSLEHRSLWQEFFCRGTEMIVNRAGR